MSPRRSALGVWLAALGLLGLAPSGLSPNPAEVRVWVTTGDQSKLIGRQPDTAFSAGPSAERLTVRVDTSQRFQEIDGFGAALTDSAAWLLLNRLSAEQQAATMAKLFDAATGIGLSYVRLPVGATDFSLGSYTYHDLPAGQEDPTLARFSIAHDLPYIVPVLRQAVKANPDLKIMATPWTAPAWMKTNGSLIGGTLRASAYDAYAAYLRRFIEAYARLGITIDAITLQNEPDFAPPGYPGMLLTPEQEAELAHRVGTALRAAGIRTKIVGYDGNWENSAYAVTLLGDSRAAHLAGVAFHCYRGDPSAQSEVHSAFPGTNIYFTECSGGEWAPSFADNLVWNVHTLVIGATRNWARTVLHWNLALDQHSGPTNGGCTNCRGMVTVDSSTGEVAYNVEYYSLGHVSRFVRTGAHRVASTTLGLGSIESVAFRNPDGTVALVVLNSDSQSRTFAVEADGQTFDYSLPAGAVATFSWWQASSRSVSP